MNKLSKEYTDCLKIISALLVVVGHYASTSIVQGWSSTPIWKVIASQFGFIGVAVFFFLSGYGLSESDSKCHLSLTRYLNKRFLKIYKPTLLITIIWLAIEYVLMDRSCGLYSIYDLFWGFDDCVLWFIKILFGLYVSFFVFSEFFYRGYKACAWGSLIVGSLLLIYIANILEGYSSIAIPCFILGVLYSREANVRQQYFLLSLAISCSIIYTFITNDNHGVHAAINYLCIASMLLLYRRLPSFAVSNHKIVTIGGTVSFDLYLTHMKVLDFLVYKKCYFGGGNFLIVLTICIAISVAFHIMRRLLKCKFCSSVSI